MTLDHEGLIALARGLVAEGLSRRAILLALRVRHGARLSHRTLARLLAEAAAPDAAEIARRAAEIRKDWTPERFGRSDVTVSVRFCPTDYRGRRGRRHGLADRSAARYHGDRIGYRDL